MMPARPPGRSGISIARTSVWATVNPSIREDLRRLFGIVHNEAQQTIVDYSRRWKAREC